MSLNGIARPILQRFQGHVSQLLRGYQPKAVAIALSGGVDSVALSWLWHKSHTSLGSDSLFGRLPLNAIIVDHKLQPESTMEAQGTAARFEALTGRTPWVVELDWKVRGGPPSRSSLETSARGLRYQAIAKVCRDHGIDLVLTGHHADDQAETVLTRIANGTKDIGLSGMAPLSGIPECEKMYGVNSISSDRDAFNDLHALRLWRNLQQVLRNWPPLTGPDIQIMKPLLPFRKTDLYRICEEEGLKWAEDKTNRDPTLTKRNAIRQMLGSDVLPRALRTDRLLQLADTARESEDAEYRRVKQLHELSNEKGFNPETGVLGMSIPFVNSEPRHILVTYLRDIINALTRTTTVSRVSCELLAERIANFHGEVEKRIKMDEYDLSRFITTAGKSLPVVGDVRTRAVYRPDKALKESPEAPLSWSFHSTLPPGKHLSSVMDLTVHHSKYHGRILANPDFPNPTLWDGRFWMKVRVHMPHTREGQADPHRRLFVRVFNEEDYRTLHAAAKAKHADTDEHELRGQLWRLKRKWSYPGYPPAIPVLCDTTHQGLESASVAGDGPAIATTENLLAIPALRYVRSNFEGKVAIELAHKRLGNAGLNAKLLRINYK